MRWCGDNFGDCGLQDLLDDGWCWSVGERFAANVCSETVGIVSGVVDNSPEAIGIVKLVRS